jgi:hypothetical protein
MWCHILCIFLLAQINETHLYTKLTNLTLKGTVQESAWELYVDGGFPVWIASNKTDGNPAYQRKIFVFIESHNFSKENIHAIFTSLATRYREPVPLQITALSDKENLRKAMDVSQMGYYVDFADTSEGRASADDWHNKYWPAAKGYFRARYYRSLVKEDYNYSPDPQKEELVEIVIRKRPDAPIIEAVRNGKIEIVRTLLEAGGNPNAASPVGITALRQATSAGQTEIVKLLLNYGADPNTRDRAGITPLMRAGSQEVIALLLDYGANVNAQDNEGWTPLMRAVLWGNTIDIVQFLLDRGADVSIRNKQGQTAWDLAKIIRNEKIADKLRNSRKK